MYSSVIRGFIRTDAFSLNTLVRYYILVFQHRYVVHYARANACVCTAMYSACIYKLIC